MLPFGSSGFLPQRIPEGFALAGFVLVNAIWLVMLIGRPGAADPKVKILRNT